jgi:methylglutaconyl-CoA hydratase
MTYRFLDSRRDGSVEYLMLNRPDVRNALNDEVIAELTAWAAAARAYSCIRVVLLAGS